MRNEIALNRASTKTTDVFFRLRPAEKVELVEIAKARGISLSALVRSSVLVCLPSLGKIETAPVEPRARLAAHDLKFEKMR